MGRSINLLMLVTLPQAVGLTPQTHLNISSRNMQTAEWNRQQLLTQGLGQRLLSLASYRKNADVTAKSCYVNLVVWGLSSAMVSSRYNKLHSLEREIKSSEDRVQLPTWRGHWKRSHKQSSHPMDCTCTCTCTGVGAHTGWASQRSADWLIDWLIDCFKSS